jgi:hypothetical protein
MMEYNLERWNRPDSFMAMDSGWQYSNAAFVFLGRHRDSDLLTESNFECGLKAIGGESDTVKVVRESHWAVGWVEWIAIHESDIKALECASDIIDSLSDYPVVNEGDFSEREWEAAQDMWCELSLPERVDLCRDADLSIFAARGDSIPQGDNGYIYEHCLGY